MGSHTAHPPLHTAEHLLTKLLHDRFPELRAFRTRLKSRKGIVTFRYEGQVTEEDRVALEKALEKVSEATLPVMETYLSRQEAERRLPNMHQVPQDAIEVRVVRIGAGETLADERACIGSHVANTSEIRNPRLPTLREEAPGQWRINLVVD